MNNQVTPQYCKVKRSYPAQCNGYNKETCGDKLAGSFVDFCETCKKPM